VETDPVVELVVENLPASHALQRFDKTCSNNTVDDEDSALNVEVGGVNPDKR
jgi:hypothetical protein